MGLDFIKTKSEGFENQIDDCLSREIAPDLFSNAGTDESERVFRCVLDDPNHGFAGGGYRLILRAYQDGSVRVIDASNEIGRVHNDDVVELIHSMKKSKIHTSIISVLVVDAPDFSGEFRVRPVRPLK